MPSFWDLPASERLLVFDQASAKKGWVASSVEKDYWVSYTLRHLFTLSALEGNLTFKGGTSLSKAWGLIDRFSEDLDLTIGRDALGFGGDRSPEKAPTAKQQGKRLKELRKACAAFVETVVLPQLIVSIQQELGPDGWSLQLDADDPDQQTILFAYPTLYHVKGARYVRPIVKIELGARSDPWPAQSRPIKPLIAELYPGLKIDATLVQVLAPERTFWEKAMLLHEERYRPDTKPRRARMARHYYDIYRLIESGVSNAAIADMALFSEVAAHRKVFYNVSWVDYDTLLAETLDILPHDAHIDDWSKDYVAMQAEMFSDVPPDFQTILRRVSAFQHDFRASLQQRTGEL